MTAVPVLEWFVMKKTTLICSAIALLCALPYAQSAAQNAPYVPGIVLPNPDLRGTWKLKDANEQRGQPKTIKIMRVPGSYTAYYAIFIKSNNKCPIKKSPRSIYLRTLKVGFPNKPIRIGDKMIPGNRIVKGKMWRCSSRGYIRKCRGKEIHVVDWGGVLETDSTGKVVRIKALYKSKYYDVKGKKPNFRCVRNKRKDTIRSATLTRVK